MASACVLSRVSQYPTPSRPRLQDQGYAVTLWRGSFKPGDIEAGLARLLPPELPQGERSPAQEAIHRAWLQNVAAGGVVRAVQVRRRG